MSTNDLERAGPAGATLPIEDLAAPPVDSADADEVKGGSCTTPHPGGPVPIPYPNTSTGSSGQVKGSV